MASVPGRDGHDVVDEVGDDWRAFVLVDGAVSLSNQGLQVFVRWTTKRPRLSLKTFSDKLPMIFIEFEGL
jgi:hypothetical protein